MIKVKDERDQVNIAKVYKANQQHIFRWWEELSSEDRRKLLDQIVTIDFQLLQKLINQHFKANNAQPSYRNFEPAPVFRLPRNEEEKRQRLAIRELGEEILRQNEVAVVLVAGGQGTRLGFPGPKGTFPIGPITRKSLFQIHAEKIIALSKRHRVTIPWYIMVSEDNRIETKQFFRENNHFTLSNADVFFFPQRSLPAIDLRGKLLMDSKSSISTSPNGHGGVVPALKESGALEDMRRRGIKYIFYFQVDNPLAVIADPLFIGYHVKNDADMSLKVVWKRDPAEKVGLVVGINGRPRVIEYSELSKEEINARDERAELVYGAGSIAIHMLNVDFVEKLNQEGHALPYHKALKEISYINKKGELISPTKPNGIKSETFIFDALAQSERTVILEVDRHEEFYPLKNKEGENSPAAVRKAMNNRFGKWLEEARIEVPRDGNGNVKSVLEISPLFALDAEELKEKVSGDLVIGESLLL
jgi:UDP-N-acetylglucosamine/UDP-N-acetylgalactosamine diphosphorylase